MWLKQIQIYEIDHLIKDIHQLREKLAALAFHPCLPSLPFSAGWVSPVDEEGAPLVHGNNDYQMICLQFEEKVLPATIVRQAVQDRTKEIEHTQQRKISGREKLSLREDLTQTLLTQAFCKRSRVYAYFDIKNNWLILGTSNALKTEKFLTLINKSLPELELSRMEAKGVSGVFTRWLTQQSYPPSFAINQTCVLIDPSLRTRTVRTRQQDLFAKGVQLLLKDGLEVHQIGLTWNNQVDFVLGSDLVFQSIKCHDELLEESKDNYAESEAARFDADFILMTRLFSGLITEIVGLFEKSHHHIEEAISA
jgi:recombination associated protein RdgC